MNAHVLCTSVGLGKLRLAIGLGNGWLSALKWEWFWGIKARGSHSTEAACLCYNCPMLDSRYKGNAISMASARKSICPHSPGLQDGKLPTTFLAASLIIVAPSCIFLQLN